MFQRTIILVLSLSYASQSQGASVSLVTSWPPSPFIFPNNLHSDAYGNQLSDLKNFPPGAFPFIVIQHASAGGSSSLTTYNLTGNLFRIEFQHRATGDVNRIVGGADRATTSGLIHFRLDTDVKYIIEGMYTTVHFENRDILYGGHIQEMATFEKIFNSSNYKVQSQSTTTDLTRFDGPYGFLTGSPTGVLLKDHHYAFEFLALLTSDYPVDEEVATGSGYFQIRFEEVPEPSIWLGCPIGLVILALRRFFLRTHRALASSARSCVNCDRLHAGFGSGYTEVDALSLNQPGSCSTYLARREWRPQQRLLWRWLRRV